MEEYGDMDSLIESVLEEGRNEAEDIVRIAKKAADRDVESAMAKLKKEKEIQLNRRRDTYDTARKRSLSKIGIETKRKLLQKKEECVNSILRKTQEKLAAMDRDDTYFAIVKQLCIEAAGKLPSEQCEIVFSEHDREFLASRPDDIADITGKETGIDITVSNETASISGGVIARVETKDVQYDNSFEARIQRKHDNLRKRIAEELDF